MPLNSLLWSSVLFVVLLSSRVCALNPARSLLQYNCQSWVRQNGLPANGVYSIVQTADGYLWLGTPRGLVRFDGEEFKLFDMSEIPGVRSTIITSICRARDGGFWFGMERGGFGYYDGSNFSLRGKDEWGGKNLFVQSLVETREGELWIGAERLAARLIRRANFEPILTNAGGSTRYDVTALCEDSRGRVWLGTAQQGLFYWEKGVLTRFPHPAVDELMIRCLAEDKQGQLWVGTQHGLICFDSNLKRQPLPFPWYETRALLVDREGTVWAGTTGGGLVRFENGNPLEFRKVDGLADDFVNALAEDFEGSLWVGTRNGLSQLSDVKIPTLGRAEGLGAEVNVGVYPSRKGGFWVATGEGYAFYDAYGHSYPTNGLRNPYIVRILEARTGDLFLINASKDIEVFSSGKLVARYTNNVWPTAMVEDAEGVVVAAGGELQRVGAHSVAPYTFRGEKPPLRWVFSMCTARDGSIWVAGHSGDVGICRIKDGAFTLWKKDQGLPDTKVRWVCEDSDGVIWAGLERGIARVKNGQLRVITRENGLFDNIINAIVPDDYGSLWIDSGRGFFSVRRDSLNAFADGKLERVTCVGYDGPDAIKSSEKNQQQASGCKTPDGRIWFPTAQGIVMIDPTNLTINPVPPQVHVQNVRANGHELKATSKAVMPPGRGELEFHYAGLSFIAPAKIHYRYQLEGYDKSWVEADTRRSAFYTNLKPGKYHFEVQACNSDGIWNTAGACFEVELLPYFYETTWFFFLSGGLVALLLFGLYAWRIRRLQRNHRQLLEAQALLEARVQERTAELKNEIEERKRVELEVERVHRQLLEASRQAGQAEVASSVLHNVGNVLNSVNVSTTLIADRVRNSRLTNLTKSLSLLRQHEADLGGFLSRDDRGKKLLPYLESLAEHFRTEQEGILSEIKGLGDNVQHIKEIVVMQQNYARVSGTQEVVEVTELVEAALKVHSGAYFRHSVKVVREYEAVPKVIVDRHKVLQILINILQNAKQACAERTQAEKRVTVRVQPQGPDRVKIEIADNGVGIAPENLTRIFSHGFTTRKDGHGFGLHSAALAAKEMGGSVTAHSEGLGKGATFMIELPVGSTAQKSAETSPKATSVA